MELAHMQLVLVRTDDGISRIISARTAVLGERVKLALGCRRDELDEIVKAGYARTMIVPTDNSTEIEVPERPQECLCGILVDGMGIDIHEPVEWLNQRHVHEERITVSTLAVPLVVHKCFETLVRKLLMGIVHSNELRASGSGQDIGERKDNHAFAGFLESSTDTLQVCSRLEVVLTVDIVHVGKVQVFAIVVIARNDQDRGPVAESFFHLVENFGIVLIGAFVGKVTGKGDCIEIVCLVCFKYLLEVLLYIKLAIVFAVDVDICNLKNTHAVNYPYVEVGKKNGKSELAAAIALYLLFADGEAGAEVYSCAADINQASIVFNTAKAMVEQCGDLAKLSKLVPSTKRIIFPHTNSFYRVLSSETKSKQGFNVSGLIFDELFAQQTRELFDTMTKYTGDARRQPLYFLITTAGRDKTSICYEIHQKAKAVMDGSKIDPSFYPAVFGIEEDDDWNDEAVWRRVNPSIDVTIPFETVQAAYEQAKQNPAEEMHFRQFRLNEWCNADIRWMPMDKWDACGEDIDFEEYEGRDCYCGLDLSSTGDLTASLCIWYRLQPVGIPKPEP